MTFEQFLMTKCMEDTHTLDDDLPDVYEAWIVEQDVSDIIKWATEWHSYLLEDANKYKKDEIEGILEAIIGDMDYVSEYCDGTESREQAEESRGKLLAFITSLIEQESERAVREFAQHCDEKDSSYTGMELHQHAEKAEQYLAERKS